MKKKQKKKIKNLSWFYLLWLGKIKSENFLIPPPEEDNRIASLRAFYGFPNMEAFKKKKKKKLYYAFILILHCY
jgi:hypothetical protein